VLVFTDDQGYGDLGCFGSEEIPTPHIDRLATEGMRFTSFLVSQAVCSASRTALLTGCYSERVSVQGALSAGARVGLNPDEETLAEVLKERGYATVVPAEVLFRGTEGDLAGRYTSRRLEVAFTRKGGTLFATAFDWPGDELRLPLPASVPG